MQCERGIFESNISPLYETQYSRADQVNFFKGYLRHILLGPFLNTLSHTGGREAGGHY